VEEKKIICIECPQGCELTLTLDEGKVLGLTGNTCPKGDVYGRKEMECPERVLTTSVCAEGLSVVMVSVRTDKAIPKDMWERAMDRVREIILTKPVGVGAIVDEDFLGLGVNLIATREAR